MKNCVRIEFAIKFSFSVITLNWPQFEKKNQVILPCYLCLKISETNCFTSHPIRSCFTTKQNCCMTDCARAMFILFPKHMKVSLLCRLHNYNKDYTVTKKDTLIKPTASHLRQQKLISFCLQLTKQFNKYLFKVIKHSWWQRATFLLHLPTFPSGWRWVIDVGAFSVYLRVVLGTLPPLAFPCANFSFVKMHEANRRKKLLCLYVICAIDVAPETFCSHCSVRTTQCTYSTLHK